MTASLPAALYISFELSTVVQHFLVLWRPCSGEDDILIRFVED